MGGDRIVLGNRVLLPNSTAFDLNGTILDLQTELNVSVTTRGKTLGLCGGWGSGGGIFIGETLGMGIWLY